jgi:amicoumacin kinase
VKLLGQPRFINTSLEACTLGSYNNSMDPNIKRRFQENHLTEASRLYGIDPHSIKLLDGFESFIYEFRREDVAYVLRIGHSSRRTPEMIHAEVDWINYLAAGMGPENDCPATAARAVYSLQGRLVESLPDGHGEEFLATAFIRAQGRCPSREMLIPPLIENYGRMIGRMHALSCDYQPADLTWMRPHWNDPSNLVVAEYLPPGEEQVVERFDQLMAHLNSLPCSSDAYAMIHQDAHTGNLFADENNFITLFDFDDCCYGFFIYDISMVLFYAALFQPNPANFTRNFMTAFLRGYQREYDLHPAWLAEIPHFLKLREIDLYALIHRSFDLNNLTDKWTIRYLDGRKEKIEAGIPFIDFDFTSLANT